MLFVKCYIAADGTVENNNDRSQPLCQRPESKTAMKGTVCQYILETKAKMWPAKCSLGISDHRTEH